MVVTGHVYPFETVDAAKAEIASRIAAAARSKPEYKLDELLQGMTEENLHPELPPSEWSPTIGQPEAANSDVKQWDREVVIPIPEGSTITRWPLVGYDPRYTTLRAILDAAFNHAATGKGKERHARDLPFDKQPMLETTRLVGPGFPLGQAIKKSQEASGMIERGELDAAEAECLGGDQLSGWGGGLDEGAEQGEGGCMSLNEEQRDYMRYLATVPAEKKCWCAWYMAGECPNCKDLGTLAQRLKVQCPGCNNYPPVTNQTRPVVHRIGCTSPDWQPTSIAVAAPTSVGAAA